MIDNRSVIAPFFLAVILLGLFSVPVLAEAVPVASFALQPLHALPEFSSINGVLTATLDVTAQKIDLGSISFDGMTYNNDYGAPLLRVHAGDIMHIKLVNHLNEKTNIHFHGLHTSPMGNGDNIYTEVKPGDSFDYEIKIAPTQPPGLYWYHPHIHGQSERLVNNGLSGALLVEGIKTQIPALADVKEQVMVLKEYTVETTTNPEMKRLHKIVQTINGQMMSKITMHTGETQLWHIVNPGADDYLHFSVKGHHFRIIGRDGVTVNKESLVSKVDIGPAMRVDVLVDAGDEVGNFDIISEGVPTGAGADQSDNRILGSVSVEGNVVASVPIIDVFPVKDDLRQSKIDARRTVVFTQDVAKGEYYVDGRLFDHNRIDARVPLGNVEEWTIENNSNDTHVFHIHQIHFQVIEINGVSVPFDGYLDTVRVPERGSVKLILPFTDPVIVGKFVYHCHILEHEDKGMMAVIEIYDPAREAPLVTWWKNRTMKVGLGLRICGLKSQSLWGRIKAFLR